MKKRSINLEAISLGDLSAIYKSEGGLFYRKIVNQIFAGRDNLFAKNRLSSRWPLNLDQETKMNNEAIHATELVLKGELVKNELKLNQYVEKKALYNEKHAEFLMIKKELEQIELDLNDIKKQIEEQHITENKLSSELSKLSEISDELTHVVLVHNSATINQLKKYQHRKMVVTKADIHCLKSIGVCDDVFSSECDIIELPYDMMARKLTPEENSAIEFVNMMLCFKIQDNVLFDAIYSDETISKLLKFNKYDEL